MTKIFLDSCVWINYIWQTQFSSKPKEKTASTKLIERVTGDKKYQVILSPFLVNEISAHFRDWFLMQKVIQDGFSYREFNREKKNYEILEQEVGQIDDIINTINGVENFKILSLEDLTKEEMREILKLEVDYYFDFYDAFHFYAAEKEKCKYFVTSDSPLKKSASKLNQKEKNNLECISPKSLLKNI